MIDALKFLITADAKTASAFGKVVGDLKGVKGALAGVDDRARRAGKAMRNIGIGASAAISAPLGLMGKQALELFDVQAKAQAAVQTALASTGGASGKSADELFRVASGLQAISTYGDEDILQNVTAPLLTFTQISGTAFDRAQKNVLDMSTLMKMDLKSASVLVGKALNDPVKGLSALSRTGVQFSEDQKKVIKALVETGDVAGAQALILNELETQFGGQAEAAAKVGLGPMKQLSNAVGDLKEELGAQLVTFLPPLLKQVQKAVDWFAALDPEVKKNVVVFGGLAAAAGPVLSVLGLATLGVTALSGAFSAMGAALLANPVILAIAAVAGGAYLIYRNWEGISGWFARRWASVRRVTGEAWEGVKGLLATYSPHAILYRNWDGVADWFKSLGPRISAAFGELWQAIKGEVSQWPGRMLEAGRQMVDSLIAGLTFGDGAKKKVRAQLDAVMAGENNGLSLGVAIGRDVTAGLALGISQGKADVGQAGQSVASDLVRETKDFLGIKSPSRVMMEIGEDVVAGLQLGINQNASQALGEMGRLVAGITEHAGGALGFVSGFQADAKSAFSDVLRGAKSTREGLASILSGVSNRLWASGFDALWGSIFPNATGNAFSGGRTVAFANGGVVTGPTLFPMAGRQTGLMGEAGPEAIMPLSRGPDGKLGVRAQTGAQGQSVANIYISLEGANGDQAVQAAAEAGMNRALEQFSRTLPDRVLKITRNPRMR